MTDPGAARKAAELAELCKWHLEHGGIARLTDFLREKLDARQTVAPPPDFATINRAIEALQDVTDMLREKEGATGFDASLALVIERAVQSLKSVESGAAPAVSTPLVCTCPKTQWTGSEPNDSTCELTEEEHRALSAAVSTPRCPADDFIRVITRNEEPYYIEIRVGPDWRKIRETNSVLEIDNLHRILKDFARQFFHPAPSPLQWASDAYVILAALDVSVDWELAPPIKKEIKRLVDAYVSPWISVRERLPEFKQQVLSWDGKRQWVDYIESVTEKRWHTRREITHWQPLPAAPSPQGESK